MRHSALRATRLGKLSQGGLMWKWWKWLVKIRER